MTVRTDGGTLRHPRALAALATIALILTGCSTPAPDPLTDDPEAPVEVENAEAPVALSPEECVVGTWRVDNGAFEDYMNSLATGVGGHMAVTGASFMRFDGEGTFSRWRDDFTFTLTHDGRTMEFVSNSGEVGDYGVVLDWGEPPTTDPLGRRDPRHHDR